MRGALHPDYWLPWNMTWSEMQVASGYELTEIFRAPYGAIPFLILRLSWESCVGIPAGHLFGYASGPVIPNVLQHISGGFASFYTFSWIYGLIILWEKPWLWNVKESWIGYPFHTVDRSVWWYYMIETSFYYSLLLSAFFDVKRSDFWELIIHHFVTIGLLSVSWTINFIRIGTLVLISHDVADILLEAGKLFRYSNCHKTLTDVFFTLFMLSWILTRLIYYPFVVIRSAIFEAANCIHPDYKVYDTYQTPYVPRILIILLAVLLILHIFWTITIAKIVIRTITGGEVKDIRSDDEGGEEEQKIHKMKAKSRTRKVD
ncbi:unnamed protein product, partial [Mesorhabditis belari]|uniref:TLC domain-containing protein n=1 Tax=Mesorhabditis belari TaxID=2138241 RepID=A0AAF3EWT3_9BILA